MPLLPWFVRGGLTPRCQWANAATPANWAKGTSAVYEQVKGLGGIVQGSQNIRFFDAANEGGFLCAA